MPRARGHVFNRLSGHWEDFSGCESLIPGPGQIAIKRHFGSTCTLLSVLKTEYDKNRFPIVEMAKQSIADKLGWSDGLRTTIFVVGLAICLSPYLGGLEIGSLKVPKVPDSFRPFALTVGLTTTVGLLLFLIPCFPLRRRSFSVILDNGAGGLIINRRLDETPGGGAVLCHLHSRWWIKTAPTQAVTIVSSYFRDADSDELQQTDFGVLDDKGDASATKEFTGTAHFEVRAVKWVAAGVKDREVVGQIVFKDADGHQVSTPWLRFSHNRVQAAKKRKLSSR